MSRYSVSRRKTQKESNCQNCNGKFWYKPSQSTGKYCTNKCYQESRRMENSLKFQEGKLHIKSMKAHLIDQNGDLCSMCGISSWNGKPLSLDIDHVDGNSQNNLPENLRLLCPNCHRQTESWGYKQSRIDMNILGRRKLGTI